MKFPSDDLEHLIDGGDYAEQSSMRAEERDHLVKLVTSYFLIEHEHHALMLARSSGGSESSNEIRDSFAKMRVAQVRLMDAVGMVPDGASTRDDGLCTPIAGREIRKPDRRTGARRTGDK